jgi:hypothetical protein
MEVAGPCSDDEMVACFLRGELDSPRFGARLHDAIRAAGLPEQVVSEPDLEDADANAVRRDLLGVTRGYGRGVELFDASFPSVVAWVRAVLSSDELAGVRYMDYPYWNELSGGSRYPVDAATRIRAGIRAYDVPHERFERVATLVAEGRALPPLILVGVGYDDLVCLEGHLRLTAYALAGFPRPVSCLVGTSPTMDRWAH